MTNRVFLPVRNNTTEGFEMKEVFVSDLTDADRKYLDQKAKLQKELGNEDKLQKLLENYLKKQPEPVEVTEEEVPPAE